jgi:hypothetical protein
MGAPNLESRVSELRKALPAFSGELRLALSYIRSDAGSSLTKSRLVLEKLLVVVYTSEMGQEPRKPLLGDMLVDNQFTRRIERRILSRMNAIRDMGNLGPHGDAVEPSDASRVLDDLCEVLEWHLRRGGEPCTEPEAGESAAARSPKPAGEGAERVVPRRAPGISPQGAADTDNLLHLMWDCLDPNLQDAFSLAYNKKRRQGGNRISTKDFFQALARLDDASLGPLIESFPEGALPEPVDLDVPRDKHSVLEESPLLSDCVEESLEHFRELEDLPRRITPADMFVDIAMNGHGPSVARLREHGVGEREIEEQVRRLGLSVLRRKGG